MQDAEPCIAQKSSRALGNYAALITQAELGAHPVERPLARNTDTLVHEENQPTTAMQGGHLPG